MKTPFVSIVGGFLGLGYVGLTAPGHQRPPDPARPAYTIQALPDGSGHRRIRDRPSGFGRSTRHS